MEIHPSTTGISLPDLYLLTCPARIKMAEQTLARWIETDWGGIAGPHVVLDDDPEEPGEEWRTPARCRGFTKLFRASLEQALPDGDQPDEWMLFLEDDLEFHPRIGALVGAWPALQDPRCAMASLFNPSLPQSSNWGEMERAFAALPESFTGTQAILLRRWAAEIMVGEWDAVPGTESQRLARLLGTLGPIWVHRPSLVQHAAKDSSSALRISRALDFDVNFGV